MLNLVRAVIAVVVAASLAGCVSFPVEKRAMQGPTSEDVWTARVVARSGRQPNFEERGQWQDAVDRRISRYLAAHPEFANSFEVQNFRFQKQVTVGMTMDQVTALLDTPDATVTDAREMERLARAFWPQIKGKASEVRLYPPGWRIFVNEGRVVDLVQYLPPRSLF